MTTTSVQIDEAPAQTKPRPAPLSQYNMTYHDIPTLPDYITCYEIREGELYMAPSPTVNHQAISRKLVVILSAHDPDQEHGVCFYAPLDVVLHENLTVQPDILYVTSERKSIIKERHIFGAPDLCIEILSPRTVDDDLSLKYRYYKESGVREYWVVNPFDQTLTVHDLAKDEKVEYKAGNAAISTLPALAGLRVDVDKLFATD
ncbi:MAG: Uma2 family endonuclease [Anaerolineae bacterium]|nr:Uma2 family endonuclease [Anaerolineae bacterium]